MPRTPRHLAAIVSSLMLAAASFAAGAEAQETPLEWPYFTGNDLNNELKLLPIDFAAPYTLAFLASSPEQEAQGALWIEAIGALFDDDPEFDYASIALFKRERGFAPRPAGGARNGLFLTDMSLAESSDVRARYFEVFGKRPDFAATLNVDDFTELNLFLVDREGAVHWRGSGAAHPDAVRSLLQALSEARI